MKRLGVAFGRDVVWIRSDADDVLDSLAHMFRHLKRAVSDRPAVGDIEIRHTTRGYECRGAAEVSGRVDTLAAAVRWAHYQTIDLLVNARPDLLWFHGAAAGFSGRVVALPGRRGSGKSTLVADLWRRGCSYLSDDILPIDPRTGCVHPFPQLPAVRRDPGRDVAHDTLGSVPKRAIDVTERVERRPLPLAAIVLPTFRREGDVELVPCSSGEAALALLEGCWSLEGHQSSVVGDVARLTRGLPACRLLFPPEAKGAEPLVTWLTRTLKQQDENARS